MGSQLSWSFGIGCFGPLVSWSLGMGWCRVAVIVDFWDRVVWGRCCRGLLGKGGVGSLFFVIWDTVAVVVVFWDRVVSGRCYCVLGVVIKHRLLCFVFWGADDLMGCRKLVVCMGLCVISYRLVFVCPRRPL